MAKVTLHVRLGPQADSCAATKTLAWPLPPAREAHVALPVLPARRAEIPIIAIGSTGAIGGRRTFIVHLLSV
jgi:hypothetical protein